MKVAIVLSQGHVSSRLDCADELLLIEIENGAERRRDMIDLRGWPVHGRSTRIVRLHVGRLVCGALSRFDEAGLKDANIELITRVAGPAEAVLSAVVTGTIVSQGNYWRLSAVRQ